MNEFCSTIIPTQAFPLDIVKNSKKTKTLAQKKKFVFWETTLSNIHFKRICCDLVSILRCETLYDARILRYAISKGSAMPQSGTGFDLNQSLLETDSLEECFSILQNLCKGRHFKTREEPSIKSSLAQGS